MLLVPVLLFVLELVNVFELVLVLLCDNPPDRVPVDVLVLEDVDVTVVVNVILLVPDDFPDAVGELVRKLDLVLVEDTVLLFDIIGVLELVELAELDFVFFIDDVDVDEPDDDLDNLGEIVGKLVLLWVLDAFDDAVDVGVLLLVLEFLGVLVTSGLDVVDLLILDEEVPERELVEVFVFVDDPVPVLDDVDVLVWIDELDDVRDTVLVLVDVNVSLFVLVLKELLVEEEEGNAVQVLNADLVEVLVDVLVKVGNTL